MVCADLYYPGWSAFVDGVSCPIFSADSLLRAVLVPAGVHHIRFEFRSISILGGFVICAATIIIICIALIYDKTRDQSIL
jgi:uncharacterized membrane protein YfhO